ncbi:5-hydroxytryptamine receptor 3C-like [Engraulis encrasicolus]|uniref:5-hydroxytryptamine receptor 3C-like n=1 Tax=Engraulis encrasicolus TaxID=184585 RepID=UPI002FD15E56
MTTSCRMDLYKFPFDTQRCTITLISFIYPIEELRLMSPYNSSTVTENSRKMFQSMGEWELINVDISSVNLTIGRFVWDRLIYTVSMGRRPLLYVVNFLLPVLYFLLLDLASFFISERGGEKLSFKVTVLLAISVLLLILHDMLPSTDQHIPLIGIYCLGIFSFVALSLLETIFVSFLLRTGSRRARTATNPAVTSALTSVVTSAPEGSPDSEQEGKCRLARVIDVIYFLSYLVSVTIFLLLTTLNWFY